MGFRMFPMDNFHELSYVHIPNYIAKILWIWIVQSMWSGYRYFLLGEKVQFESIYSFVVWRHVFSIRDLKALPQV